MSPPTRTEQEYCLMYSSLFVLWYFLFCCFKPGQKMEKMLGVQVVRSVASLTAR